MTATACSTFPDMAPKASRKKMNMTDEHKAALALGREQGRAVRRYLEALEANRPRRGRKRTQESVQKRLAEVEKKLPGADPLTRLQLVQERMDLQRELSTKAEDFDISSLEEAFVAAAAGYGARKGISYAAWREAGVPGPVLTRAGIRRND